MAPAIVSPAIKELATILQHIGSFPTLNDSDFKTCRGLKASSNGRCGLKACQAQEQTKVDCLWSEFNMMTTRTDTSDLYDKMQTFISLTHCQKFHRDNACEAFEKWKAQRKVTISNSRPSRSATSYKDSLETISSIGSPRSFTITPDSSEVDESASEDDESTLEDDESTLEDDESTLEDDESTLEDDEAISEDDEVVSEDDEVVSEDDKGTSEDVEATSDSDIAEKMGSLNIDAATQDTRTQRLEAAEAMKENLEKILGSVHLPKEGEEYNKRKIRQATVKPFNAEGPRRVVYVLEHLGSPGLFKIGVAQSPKERLKQPENCYAIGTKLIYGEESEKFMGAGRAEKIAHAILDHKRLEVMKCLECDGKHHEWFLASKQEVLNAVKLAERWLKMPAYEPINGTCIVTPEAMAIHKKLFPFSMSKMAGLLDNFKKPDNTFGSFPNITPAAVVPETTAPSASPTTGRKRGPRISVSKSPNTKSSRKQKPQQNPPEREADHKAERLLVEVEEEFKRHRRRFSDGNCLIVEEEIVKIVRKKVSNTRLVVDPDISAPIDPSRKMKKQDVKVEVREL
ncbi:hypothetical protein V8C35DRAFT_246793 [Trichoderma chlorosporum]